MTLQPGDRAWQIRRWTQGFQNHQCLDVQVLVKGIAFSDNLEETEWFIVVRDDMPKEPVIVSRKNLKKIEL